jgi:hypothetical protein
LCSSLLKIKGVAESPKLPADIKPVPKPELSEEERSALHNVTSALCNRKQVKDVIEDAVTGTCMALRVPIPDRKNKAKDQATDKKAASTDPSATGKVTQQYGDEDSDLDSPADDESDNAGEEPKYDGPPLLKRKKGNVGDGDEDVASDAGSESSDSPEFEGFSDSEAEENMFSKYDQFVGGSSDESEEEEDADDTNEGGLADTRSRSIRKLAPDDISISSGTSEDELEGSESDSDSDSDSEDEALAPPSKKTKTKAVKPASFTTGTSTFLPSLMGGYISGSESASDVDVAPTARKNRRGQRARQAIWEKKYGEKAKHHQNKDTRNEGWDPTRGAVDVNGDGSSSKPWKKGIKNPFEKNQVHPDRQRQMQQNNDRQKGAGAKKGATTRDRDSRERSNSAPVAEKPKPKLKPTRDDEGSLHPSWAAAKKAKEGVQKVEFQGKKVVFD